MIVWGYRSVRNGRRRASIEHMGVRKENGKEGGIPMWEKNDAW